MQFHPLKITRVTPEKLKIRKSEKERDALQIIRNQCNVMSFG